MKQLTKLEIEAVADYLKHNIPPSVLLDYNLMAHQIANNIDRAEGYPVDTGDKYLDAKGEIVKTIKELNNDILHAEHLGMQVIIAVEGTETRTEIKLLRLYKEWDVNEQATF